MCVYVCVVRLQMTVMLAIRTGIHKHIRTAQPVCVCLRVCMCVVPLQMTAMLAIHTRSHKQARTAQPVCLCLCLCVCCFSTDDGDAGIPYRTPQANTASDVWRRGAESWYERILRVGQNRIYTPYMTVSLVIYLPNILYIHRVYIYGSGQLYAYCTFKSLEVPMGRGCRLWPSRRSTFNTCHAKCQC
jgi:hypothetical protein